MVVRIKENQFLTRHMHWRTAESILQDHIPMEKGLWMDGGILIIDEKEKIVLSRQSCFPIPNGWDIIAF